VTLVQWSYVGMLVFCLVGTLPLVPAFRLRVLHQPRRLLLTIVLAGAPFLLWDLYATHAGHWWFDADQTLPWRVAGIPYEEVAFFVVIPLVAVLTLEATRAARRHGLRRRTEDRA
jgi:lycopene cyclase domain-containing protein